MRRLLIAAAAAAVLASSQASAVEVLPRVTAEKMAEIANAVFGKKAEIIEAKDGLKVVSVDTGNGTDDFILSDCNAQGCQIVQMTMFFNKDERNTLAAVNSFNVDRLDAQAALMPDGKLYLFRLFITDGGVTAENLKANVILYAGAETLYIQHLASQATAAIAPNGVPVAATKQTDLAAALGLQKLSPTTQRALAVLSNLPNHKGRTLPR